MDEENLKIGMYTENEIFKYITEQEGGILGRSMYDAVFNKIHNLITENQKLKEQLEISEKARKEAIELLSIAYGISVDYDGFNDVAGLKAVIDDMARAIKKAKIVLDTDKGE